MRLRRRPRSYSATAGLPFDDERLESRLVWIWSAARSGSTWFLRLLSHPLKIADGGKDPEDLLGFRAPNTWQGRLDLIPVDTTFVANHLAPLAGGADYDESWNPLTFGAGLGLTNRPNYFFSSKYEDAWRPELRRLMLVRFNRLIERAGERFPLADPLVLLKEVGGAHAAELVMSMFPRSRMIFLVRDGRDVVDSQTAANQPGGWLGLADYETPEERLEYVRRRSRTWVGDMKSIGRAFDAHPAELRRSLRYEDLLADTAGTLAPLVEWLGRRRGDRWLEQSIKANSFEDIAPERKGPTRFFRSATPGMWQENLSSAEQAVMKEVMDEELQELGYPLEVPSPGPGAGGGGSPPPPAGGRPGADSTTLVRDAIQEAAAGRDFSGLGRLVHKRGAPRRWRGKEVALTFDDGPVFKTEDVMATLNDAGAKGTFFLVGRKVAGHERLLRRMVLEGHEVGNHSFAHAAFPSQEDVRANSALIASIIGRQPSVFRPPFGAIDVPGATAAIESGMKVVLWSVDSQDVLPAWEGIDAGTLYDNVVDQVRPGSIVLMHDGQPWSRVAEALPHIVETLTARGYRLVTASELLAGGPAPRLIRRRRG